jgi:hypothetical protein
MRLALTGAHWQKEARYPFRYLAFGAVLYEMASGRRAFTGLRLGSANEQTST